jgi:hypothetical protein
MSSIQPAVMGDEKFLVRNFFKKRQKGLLFLQPFGMARIASNAYSPPFLH